MLYKTMMFAAVVVVTMEAGMLVAAELKFPIGVEFSPRAGTRCERGPGGSILVENDGTYGWPGVRICPRGGKFWDLSNAGVVEVTVSNRSDTIEVIHATVLGKGFGLDRAPARTALFPPQGVRTISVQIADDPWVTDEPVKLDGMKGDFNTNLQKLLRYEVKAHKRVIFSGDGYSGEWTQEAERRGLHNLPDTIAALDPLLDRANIALFAKYGVLSETEMKSRWEIGMDDYRRRVRIEAGIALEIARSMVRPVVADEFSHLATALGQAQADGLKVGIRGLKALSMKIGAGLDDLHFKCDTIEKAIVTGDFADQLAAMRDLRKTVDRLESLIDDSRWPLPKYREMLFVY